MTSSRDAQKKSLGRWAENLATWHLRLRGYKILARNVRTRSGEIDLVARDGEFLVFCEVKARKGNSAGDAGDAISPQKQARLVRLAELYLADHPGLHDEPCRFDAVLIDKKAIGWQVRVVADAFRPGW